MARAYRYGRMLLKEMDRLAEGGGMAASIFAEAADRIRRQDECIVMLKKMLTRRLKQLETKRLHAT